MKKQIIAAILLLFSTVFLTVPVYAQNAEKAPATEINAPVEEREVEYAVAKVRKVEEKEELITEDNPDYTPLLGKEQKRVTQSIDLVITSGEKDIFAKTFTLENITANRPKDIRVKEGDKVAVQVVRSKATKEIRSMLITDYARTTASWLYIIIFAIALLAFGRKKGLKTIIGLVFTFAMIFYVLVPSILNGADPLLVAVGVVAVSTAVLLVVAMGWNKQALSAGLGTLGGTIVAALLGITFTHFSHITGFASEEAIVLYNFNPNLNYGAILLAGVIIGAFGAVMDVAVSISSSLGEIRQHSNRIGFKELFASGMKVGKDIVGTMSDTLILAYVGAALPLILLLAINSNTAFALNQDFIVDEIIRAIAGSLGLMAAIPITAYFAALFESKNR